MSRLIDADALKVAHGMKDDCADCDRELRGKSRSCEFDRIYSLMDFCGWLDDAPTIEPKRKTGKWLPIIESDEFGEPYQAGVYCSECGFQSCSVDNYCSNCGARLEEGEKDALN